ncbi:hypothetical protein [Alteromonas naphthalenivorans]|nr:hypothetical protein [Alteromonas naphthalenivorans]
MTKLNCKVYVDTNSNHLQQVYTGLAMLHRQEKINLKLVFDKSVSTCTVPFSVQSNILNINIEGKRICFDMSDGTELSDSALKRSDVYFKRSFNSSFVDPAIASKVMPYGLNYLVYPNGFDIFGFRRCVKFYKTPNWFKEVIKQADFIGKMHYKVSCSALSASPVLRTDPKTLFLARLWDINADSYFAVDEQHSQQRRGINEQRAKCISLLKKELGNRFTGGLLATEFALSQHPELVVKDARLTSKHNYITTLKAHDICVASTGLHDSIGWKFGEYIATSKAIVAERNDNVIPQLETNKHFLEFSSAEQCVEQVLFLYQNEDYRFQMMRDNQRYYESSLRPDRLLLNCFERAL